MRHKGTSSLLDGVEHASAFRSLLSTAQPHFVNLPFVLQFPSSRFPPRAWLVMSLLAQVSSWKWNRTFILRRLQFTTYIYSRILQGRYTEQEISYTGPASTHPPNLFLDWLSAIFQSPLHAPASHGQGHDLNLRVCALHVKIMPAFGCQVIKSRYKT